MTDQPSHDLKQELYEQVRHDSGEPTDLTSLKLAEDELRTWAHLFEDAKWGIAISSQDGQKLAAVNRAFAQMHGYTTEELRDRPIIELFAEPFRSQLGMQLECAHGRGQFSLEAEHVRKDGTRFPVRINITSVKDRHRTPQYRAVHVEDITQQRLQEAALQSANLSRDVLDRLLEGCQVIDFEFRYLYLNDLVVTQARRPKAALLGRTMMECYPGIEDTPLFVVIRRCMSQRTVERFENDFTFPDGAQICFELRMIPVPQGLCILSLDVTERRNRLAAIVHDSDDAIIGRRIDGVVTNWNRSAERMFGYSAHEMIGRSIDALFLPERAALEAQLAERLIRGEHISHFETKYLRKNGKELEVSVTLSPIRSVDGEIIGVSKIARDISELKRIQLQLVRAKEATEAVNRELEAFTYSVAHDLRAPLRSIDGFSQALLEDCHDKLDDEGKRYLRYVRESAQLMAQLINDLLELSRVTRSELWQQPVNLSVLAATVVNRLRQREPHRRVDVQIQPGMTTVGDPRLLTIMLDNLLGNAWKFTSKRAQAQIEFGVTEGSANPRSYFVRDNGAGFDMRYVHKLFGAFARLHGAHEFEGTGIGLATVQRIILRHGGRVWAEGKVNEGATFYFTIPPKESAT